MSYLSLLKASYLVGEVPGWVPPARSRKRLAVKPKRYLADSSLAAAQLGMGPDALLHDWQTFGLLFESLCMRTSRSTPDARGRLRHSRSLSRSVGIAAASPRRDTAASLV